MKINEQTIRKVSKVLGLLLAIAVFFSLFLFVPQIRELIISLGERVIGRALSHDVWNERFIEWEIKWIVTALLFLLLFLYISFGSFPKFSNSEAGIFHIRQELAAIRKSKYQFISILSVFVVLIGVRFFFISQKKSFYDDEGLSISICNRNEYGFWGKNYELNHEYKGKELKEISLWDNPSVLDSLRDVFHMHQYNRDTPHSNFYYSLLRLWFTGTKTGNLNYIVWRGCLLNILIFVVSFFFMMLLLKRFSESTLIVALSLFIAFINPASISLTVFLRPYELQQTFVIVLTYYVVCIFQSKEENNTIITKKNYIVGIFVLGLTMLSAYFNMIVIGLYGLLIILYCIRKNDWNLLKFFIFLFIGGLIVAKLLYFDFGNISYRGAEAVSKLSFSNILINIFAVKDGLLEIFTKNIFWGVYCAVSLILCVFIFIRSLKNRELFILSTIVTINLISLLVIMYFAPLNMKYLRYIAPLFPIFSLCFVNLFNQKYLKNLVPAVISLVIIFSLIQFKGDKSVVEHLDDSDIEKYSEIQKTDLVIFVRGSSNWRYSCLIPYLDDESRVIFVENYSDLENNYIDNIPCIFINQIDGSANYDFTVKNLCRKQLQSVLYHDVYLIGK